MDTNFLNTNHTLTGNCSLNMAYNNVNKQQQQQPTHYPKSNNQVLLPFASTARASNISPLQYQQQLNPPLIINNTQNGSNVNGGTVNPKNHLMYIPPLGNNYCTTTTQDKYKTDAMQYVPTQNGTSTNNNINNPIFSSPSSSFSSSSAHSSVFTTHSSNSCSSSIQLQPIQCPPQEQPHKLQVPPIQPSNSLFNHSFMKTKLSEPVFTAGISSQIRTISPKSNMLGEIIQERFGNELELDASTFTYSRRKRKKAYEVERHYKCNYKNCDKAYGTLNHLNTHIAIQKHGEKRLPQEFATLRKELRKQRREKMRKLKKLKIKNKNKEQNKLKDDSTFNKTKIAPSSTVLNNTNNNSNLVNINKTSSPLHSITSSKINPHKQSSISLSQEGGPALSQTYLTSNNNNIGNSHTSLVYEGTNYSPSTNNNNGSFTTNANNASKIYEVYDNGSIRHNNGGLSLYQPIKYLSYNELQGNLPLQQPHTQYPFTNYFSNHNNNTLGTTNTTTPFLYYIKQPNLHMKDDNLAPTQITGTSDDGNNHLKADNNTDKNTCNNTG